MLALVDWTGWSASAIAGFEPRWRELASGDFALRGRAAGMTAPPRRGALTAKFALGGTEHYRTQGRALAADDDGWIVLGAGERYASRIGPGRPVSTISMFFAPRSVAAAEHARTADPRQLLDDPGALPRERDPMPVGRRRFAYDRELAAAVAAVALHGDASGIAELHALVLERLVAAGAAAERERAAIGAVRATTRAEVHRRLSRAHDYLMTAYGEPLTLHDLASVAAMAPHHFLRAFRDAFGITPHRALIRRRIAVAARLLETTDVPVGRIAAEVGFTTLAAFSTRFRRETGRSPRRLRERGASR